MTHDYTADTVDMRMQLDCWLSDPATFLNAHGRDSAIVRFEYNIEGIDPLSWLIRQSAAEKLYWKDRDRGWESAGIGAADVVVAADTSEFPRRSRQMAQCLPVHASRCRYYGGLRFSLADVAARGDMPAMPAYRFIVPRFEITSGAGNSGNVACNIRIDQDTDPVLLRTRVLDAFDGLVFDAEVAAPAAPQPYAVSRCDQPERSQWRENVAGVLGLIRTGAIQKLVLARRSSFTFADPIDPFRLMRHLQSGSLNCYNYCFTFADGRAFIGASPERLFRRSGRQLALEALAGTRGRGDSPEEDRKCGMDLLASDKDSREHQFVMDDLCAALRELNCRIDDDSGVSLVKLSRVQHLLRTVHAIAPPGPGDAEILAALHPTSAVGGVPADAVTDHIHRFEPFSRGWYAGPVGWIGRDESEFAVAIRSGIVCDRRLDVFTGAGIVSGSDPDEEWCEIENKLASFLGDIFSPRCGVTPTQRGSYGRADA